ncbi:MAG: segregation and condensation protein A [Alphaproteobacteria bacterium]|jgi:segregation and condensation protein A
MSDEHDSSKLATVDITQGVSAASLMDSWEDNGAVVQDDSDALMVDVDGFEGPLDLLLAMARTQKVDLARISILQLAEQYLGFVEEARSLRIELAADYLVMAAWLAFLKSRLLLPREGDDGEELSGEELAQRLAFRLMRLDAMRQAAAQLMTRKRLGRDVFGRGSHEKTETIKETVYKAEIFDLLKAYTEPRRRTAKVRMHVVKKRPAWSIKSARMRLQELVGVQARTWVQLDQYLVRYLAVPEEARSVLASSFGASLEMAREGLVDLRQDDAFAPLFVRRRDDADNGWDGAG